VLIVIVSVDNLYTQKLVFFAYGRARAAVARCSAVIWLEVLPQMAQCISNINNTLKIVLDELRSRRAITIDREVHTNEGCSQTTASSEAENRNSQSTQTQVPP